MWVALAVTCAFAAEPVPEAPRLGLWEAALALDATPAGAVARCDEIRVALRSVADGVQVDPDSVALMRRVRDASIDLDLGKLHAMLPEQHGDAHSLHACGDARPGGYGYTLFPSAAEQGAALGLLDISSDLTMTPVEHAFGAGQGYSMRSALRIGTSRLAHTRIASAFEQVLVALQTASTAPHDEARLTAARRQQPRLTEPADLAIVGAFLDAAPRLTAELSSYVDLHRVGGVHGGQLDLSVDARIDTDALGDGGYPQLERYLERMGDVLRVDLSVRDGHGHVLAEIALRTSRPGVALRAVVREGAFVPRHGGEPHDDHVVRLTDPSIDLTLVIDTELRFDGLLTRVTDLRIPVRYRSGPTRAEVEVDIDRPPGIELTGTSTVSTWLAALADSALNLEAQGEVMFRAVTEGVDGRGSRMRATYGDGELSGLTELVMVDNASVRLATRMAGRYLAPPDEVVREGLGFLSKAITRLEEDYDAARPAMLGHPTER